MKICANRPVHNTLCKYALIFTKQFTVKPFIKQCANKPVHKTLCKET